MGKLKHLGMSLLLATTFFSCGDDYDDTALRNDVNDLKSSRKTGIMVQHYQYTDQRLAGTGFSIGTE